MTVDQVFSQLCTQVSELLDQLSDLRTTVSGYGPARDEAVLVDVFCDLLEDLQEQLNPAFQSFSTGQLAAQSADFQTARRALSQGHMDWLTFSKSFHTRLYTYERSADLVRFGRTNKAKWKPWAHIIQSGLNQCQTEILQIESSLLAAWRASCESLPAGPVAIQAISLGHEQPGARSAAARSARTRK
jgi:hypothetical protein